MRLNVGIKSFYKQSDATMSYYVIGEELINLKHQVNPRIHYVSAHILEQG